MNEENLCKEGIRSTERMPFLQRYLFFMFSHAKDQKYNSDNQTGDQ